MWTQSHSVSVTSDWTDIFIKLSTGSCVHRISARSNETRGHTFYEEVHLQELTGCAGTHILIYASFNYNAQIYSQLSTN